MSFPARRPRTAPAEILVERLRPVCHDPVVIRVAEIVREPRHGTHLWVCSSLDGQKAARSRSFDELTVGLLRRQERARRELPLVTCVCERLIWPTPPCPRRLPLRWPQLGAVRHVRLIASVGLTHHRPASCPVRRWLVDRPAGAGPGHGLRRRSITPELRDRQGRRHPSPARKLMAASEYISGTTYPPVPMVVGGRNGRSYRP